jgi:HTH-type transcriptional regulator / antitoxin HipB
MIVNSPKDLGLLVRDTRTKRGSTQAEVAARVGVSRKWIIDLEAGKRTADLSLVLRTLRALGLELDAKDRSHRLAGRTDVDINSIVDRSRSRRR